jgi:hypothetical protein
MSIEKAVLRGYNPKNRTHKNYSPNNIRRLILTPDGCHIQYYVITPKNNLFNFTNFSVDYSLNNKSLDVLKTPIVHSMIEEVVFDNIPSDLVHVYNNYLNNSSFIRLKSVYVTNIGSQGYEELIYNHRELLTSPSSTLKNVFESLNIPFQQEEKNPKGELSTFLRPQYYELDNGKLKAHFDKLTELKKREDIVAAQEKGKREALEAIKTKGYEKLKRYNFSLDLVNALTSIENKPLIIKSMLSGFTLERFISSTNGVFSANEGFKKDSFNRVIKALKQANVNFNHLDHFVPEDILTPDPNSKGVELSSEDIEVFYLGCELVGKNFQKQYVRMLISVLTHWGSEKYMINTMAKNFKFNNQVIFTNKVISESLNLKELQKGNVTTVTEQELLKWKKIREALKIEESKLESENLQVMFQCISDNILQSGGDFNSMSA